MTVNAKLSTAKGQDLYRRAKKLIPGGTQLLSKRPELFLPDQWPSYFSKAHGVEVTDVDGNTYVGYVLNARAGQHMQINVASPAGNVYLTLVSPGGSPLARAQAGAQSFNDTLPESGDYTVQLSAPSGTSLTTYLLTIAIT